jgi:DNA-3-methyladenine glycosylase I
LLHFSQPTHQVSHDDGCGNSSYGGVPVRDDRLLVEFVILEEAQAGLSWITILKKRDNYRIAFDQFDPEIVAKYGKRKQQNLLANAGIVRNRLKIESARR